MAIQRESRQQYRRAPIVEAVVEFQYTSEIDMRLIGKLAARIAKRYKLDEVEHSLSTTVAFGKPAEHSKIDIGRRLSSNDRRHSCHIRTGSLLFVELAPYEGWTTFQERIERDFATLSSFDQFPVLKQIGMRYINRIDIHRGRFPDWKIPDFLNYSPSPVPQHFLQNVEYSATPKRPFVIKMITATVVSPVPYSDALALDIDVIRNADLPADVSGVISLLDQMRMVRNEIFEDSITDKAREIFSK